MQKYYKLIERLTAEYETDGCSPEDATKEAYNELLPRIRSTLNKMVYRKILACEQVLEDPVIETIKEKQEKLEEDGMDSHRAWKKVILKSTEISDQFLPEESSSGKR